MQTFPLATLLVVGSLLVRLAAGAISNVCTNINVSYNDISETAPVYMTANCQTNSGTRNSQLDLNQCFGIMLGSHAASTIVSQDRGNFGHSCTSCDQAVSGDALIMTCHCLAYYDPELGAMYMDTSISLDTGADIVDSNGFLRCFGHIGTEIRS